MKCDNMWKNIMNRETMKKLVVISLLKKIFIFALLFFASDAFAASCEAGFTDAINIKVIDYKYRPIEGAEVTVTYQKDQTTGKGYVTTNPRYTSEDGKLTETIRNTEVFGDRVKCDVTITAEYDGEIVEKEIEAENHFAEIIVRFEDARLLGLRVVDKLGAPIANTQIRINQMYKNTSESGQVNVIVNMGTVEVAVPYLNGVITQDIEVTDDTSYTLQARVYSMSLEVVDDQGDPLVAQIFVEDNEYEGTGVEIEEIALQNPYVKVVYGALEQTPPIDLVVETNYLVSFDLTPPEITSVEVERDEEDLRIRFFVYDYGTYATGPDLDETTVSYTIGGITEYAVPYVDSGTYIVEMPTPPVNTLLRFTITTYDMEGNMNTVNGQYLVTPEAENGQIIPPTNETNGDDDQPPTEPEDNTLLIIVGVVVVVILAYAVWSYVRGLTEEE
ncbi:MAG: hypothetical protein GY852_08735 [bacterium]|nr:hypothetical protein [bacterium]